MRVASSLSVLVLALLVQACGNDAPPPDSGTVTLLHDQGIDFGSGRLRDPGNFANCDLYATGNGDSGLKLSSGGDSPTTNRPITWFRSGGGLPAEFGDLASVPTSPAPTTYDALVHAKPGNGFLVVTADGDLVHGWLSAADATSLTVQWERIRTE